MLDIIFASEVSDSLTRGDKDKEIRHLLAKMDDMDTSHFYSVKLQHLKSM